MAAAAAAGASTSSGGPDPSSSSVAHRRRLTDVERPDDADGCSRHRGVRALFSVRRSYGKRASSVVDQSWVRNAVASLLGLLVLVGLLGSHRAVGGGDDGGRLLRRVDGEALGWREENLTALARLSPDTPKRREYEASRPSSTKYPSQLRGEASPSVSLSTDEYRVPLLFVSSVVRPYTGILIHIAVSSFFLCIHDSFGGHPVGKFNSIRGVAPCGLRPWVMSMVRLRFPKPGFVWTRTKCNTSFVGISFERITIANARLHAHTLTPINARHMICYNKENNFKTAMEIEDGNDQQRRRILQMNKTLEVPSLA